MLYLETLIELEQLSVLAAIFRKELSGWKGHVGWVMSVGFGWVSLGLSRVFGFSGFRVFGCTGEYFSAIEPFQHH